MAVFNFNFSCFYSLLQQTSIFWTVTNWKKAWFQFWMWKQVVVCLGFLTQAPRQDAQMSQLFACSVKIVRTGKGISEREGVTLI